MKKIGITGGIGSGKSFVSRIFKEMGIPIYNSDVRAKELMNEDVVLKKQVVDLFGEDAYKEGFLNRPFIASIVFNDPLKLKKLESFVHPAVKRDTDVWFEQLTNVPYALKEAALIYETGGQQFLDFVIVVSAPNALRIERTVKRDQITAEAVQKRMDKQFPQEKKIVLADYHIVNDGQTSLLKQIWEIHLDLIEPKQL